MIKVFLVEDEFIIREAIKHTVNWSAGGYELVGEAGDGEKAYPMILAAQPEILITDIRMPFMDGLELSRLVKEKLPRTKIIILSGYDDFSYAQEAIRIGVTQYLLKPASGAQILEVLGKVKEEILSEKEQADYKAIYEAEHAERLKYERQNFYRNLIDGRMSMPESYDKAEELGLNLGSGLFSILLFQVVRKDAQKADSMAEEETDILSDMMEEPEHLDYIGLYEQLGGITCMLVMAQGSEVLEQRLQKMITMAEDYIAQREGYLLFISEGLVVDRISEIPQAYQEATRRFAGRFRYEESHVFSSREAVPGEAEEEKDKEADKFSLSGFDIGRMDKHIIFHFLRSGSREDVPQFVAECFSGIGVSNIRSQMVRQYIAMDTYLSIASFMKETGQSNEQIEQTLGEFIEPAQVASPEDIGRYLEEIFTAAIAERDRLAENRYGVIIAQAKQLIYRDYAGTELSLGSVAHEIGVSANHLSRLFSQNVGQTFVEFLTSVRIDKAKTLLRETSLPSSEIALQVGYTDPHYFYYLFKKTQGQTPKEYRQRKEQ